MTVPKPEPYILAHGPNQFRNCWGPEYAMPFKCVVVHIMAGSLAGCDSWFNQPNNGNNTTRVSYGVGRMPNGQAEIHEYTNPKTNYRPYAHGIVNPPNTEDFLNRYRENSQRNPNYWAVGIEHGGYNLHETFAAQPDVFELSTSLTAWLCQEFNIPATENYILGHFEIDGRNRVGCPGLLVQDWTRYIQTVQAKLAGEETDMATEDAQLRNHVRFSDGLRRDLQIVEQGILVPFGMTPDNALRREVFPAMQRIAAAFNLGTDPSAQVYPIQVTEVKP